MSLPLRVMLLAAVAAASPLSAPLVPDGPVTFSVYGSLRLNRLLVPLLPVSLLPPPDSPKHTTLRTGQFNLKDDAHRFQHDISDADYLYEHPVVFVLKQDGRDELVAFFADRGLSSLHSDEHLRLVLDVLRSGGGEKTGVLLNLRKHAPLAQWRMPITKFFLPVGFNLIRLARSSSPTSQAADGVPATLPWVLVVDKTDLRPSDASHFQKVAEFTIHDHYVKIPLLHPTIGELDERNERVAAALGIFPSLLGRPLTTLTHSVTPGAADDEERTAPLISRASGIRHNIPIFI